MAKNEIPKISDFPFLGFCDGFANVQKSQQRLRPRELESQTKVDDDADTERLPTEPPTSPNSGYANESYNLRLRAWVDGSTLPHPNASLRAWVDDADTERLPLRHRIHTCMGGRQYAAASLRIHTSMGGQRRH